jgi:hypothetical protein
LEEQVLVLKKQEPQEEKKRRKGSSVHLGEKKRNRRLRIQLLQSK